MKGWKWEIFFTNPHSFLVFIHTIIHFINGELVKITANKKVIYTITINILLFGALDLGLQKSRIYTLDLALRKNFN
jgi:hypothetical protein